MKTIIYSTIIVIAFLIPAGHLQSQNFWAKLNGPFGGDVISLKKSANGNLYALRSDGLYLSTDNAGSWNRLPESMVNSNLSMDINSAGTIYVGKSTGGIWWTQNNGQSWNFNSINVAPHSGTWASVVLTKISPSGHIYINSYVSFNGGTTFLPIQIGNPAKLPADYAFNSNLVYAATNNGVYYSENNGSTWTNISGNPALLVVRSLMFHNNVLIAGIYGSGVYRTPDNGLTWEPINNGITDFDITRVYRDELNNFYAGTSNGRVFKSGNSGESWSEIYSSEPGNTINTIYSDPGNTFLATRGFGVLRSTDNGISWNERNINLNLPLINSLAFSNTGEIYSGSYYGIDYSSNNGSSWQKINNGLPSRIIHSVFRTSNHSILAGVQNFGIYRTADNGLNWVSSSNGISPGSQIKSIRSSPNGLLYAASFPINFEDTMRLYRSSDNGLNWIKVLQPNISGMEQFTMDPQGKLFVSGTDNMFQTSLLVSTDNGDTWNENILTEFFMISNLNASGNNLYMTSSTHIYYSSDLGLTWNQIPNGSWTTSGFSAVGINNASHIFASIGNEVYSTTNTGISWTLINSGLTSNTVIIKFFLNDAGYIFGTTYSKGLFKSTSSTITSVNYISNNLPGDFRLEQNYPNPFNPVTSLEFGIPDLEFVSLNVYDIKGREIAALVNEIKPAGVYKVKFDGSNLGSGVYYYKIEAGQFSAVRKMILLK